MPIIKYLLIHWTEVNFRKWGEMYVCQSHFKLKPVYNQSGAIVHWVTPNIFFFTKYLERALISTTNI